MAAISAEDIDRAIHVFCYSAEDRIGPRGRYQMERLLPWVFIQFPDAGDRYVAPLSGPRSAGLSALGTQALNQDNEYMRCSPFPHEADRGNIQSADTETCRSGPVGVHFFGNV